MKNLEEMLGDREHDVRRDDGDNNDNSNGDKYRCSNKVS